MCTEIVWLFQKCICHQEQMHSKLRLRVFQTPSILTHANIQKKLCLKPPQTWRVHLCQLIYLEHCQDQEASKKAWWEAKINTKLYYIEPSRNLLKNTIFL